MRDQQILHPLYFALGTLCVVLGIIGIFVPLIPTTAFLILTAWCFARSSRRAEKWLLEHRVFGPTIVAWRPNGAISRKHKIVALAGMTVGMAMFFVKGASRRLTGAAGRCRFAGLRSFRLVTPGAAGPACKPTSKKPR